MKATCLQDLLDRLIPQQSGAEPGRPRRVRLAFALGAALTIGIALSSGYSTARAAGNRPLSPTVPSVIQEKGLASSGSLPPAQRLHLALGLPVKDENALKQFVSDVSNPASPDFRHYLTPAQIMERFSPSEGDYAALVAFAQAHHLNVTTTCANRIVLSLEGSVADIESAFHVRLLTYNHPTEGRTFFAPDVEPTLDLAVPVLSISGLSNYVLPQQMIRPRPANVAQGLPQSGSGPGGSYLGYDFRHAYIPTATQIGSGQTVGLLEFDSGYYQSDINAYEALAGLPAVPVSPVLLDGYGGGPGGANDEVSLDIEMAIAMAPGLNQILVYEGDQTDTLLGRMSTDANVKQFGASWIYGIDPTSDELWLVMDAQGQSFYNASGDWDAYVLGVWPPADDPYIMVVGGTTLYTNSQTGAYSSEVCWNWGGGTGTGGGISETRALPDWQSGLDLTLAQGSSYRRNTPDIAWVADNIFVDYGGGGSGIFGGTSCATPLWAAYTALINQQALSLSLPTIGFVNPVIYNLAKTTTDDCLYHDIIVGNNTWSQSPTQFYAVNGYDLGTGWGTPTDYLMDAINGINTNGCWDLSAGVAPRTGNAVSKPMVQPNPTSGSCSVNFSLPTPGPVSVTVVDVNGRVVRRLLSGDQASGQHTLAWDGRDDAGRELPGGIYLTRVQMAHAVNIGRVVLAR